MGLTFLLADNSAVIKWEDVSTWALTDGTGSDKVITFYGHPQVYWNGSAEVQKKPTLATYTFSAVADRTAFIAEIVEQVGMYTLATPDGGA